MFSTKIGYCMEDFIVANEVIYCVTRNKGSLTMIISDEVYDSRLYVFIKYYHYLKDKLPDNEFENLRLSGRKYLIMSMNLGIKKVIKVFIELSKNNIRIVELKNFNPFWFLTRVRNVYNENKINKKYYNKSK